MRKGGYDLIFAVVFVAAAFAFGSYIWNQHISSQAMVDQKGTPDQLQGDQPSAQKAQSVQAEQPLLLTTPLSVSLNGRSYPINFISVRENQVIISTKKELGKFPDLEIKINLANQHVGNFSNRNLHFTGKNFSEPNIQVNWMEPGQGAPKFEFIPKNYDLQMQFGQEEDFRIPVQIKLDTKEKVTLNAVGKFIARTSDLVVVDGKVDLSQDNTDTVVYVIEQFIKQIDDVPELKSIVYRSSSMSLPGKEEKPDPNPSRVYSSASVSVDFESNHGKEAAKFLMVRTNMGWQVYRILEPERLIDAYW